MSKALKITEANLVQILGQYDLDEDELAEEMIGMYLVADFGNSQVEGFLTAEELRRLYKETGKTLENDFFEVIKREEVL